MMGHHVNRRKIRKSNLSCVHLVHRNNELTDAQCERKQGMLAGLATLRYTGLELTDPTRNDQDCAVRLGGTRDHVLNKIPMTWSINDLRSDSVELSVTRAKIRLTVTTNLGVSNLHSA